MEDKTVETMEQQLVKKQVLDTSNPHRILYKGSAASYTINGGLRKEWDSLKITLVIGKGGKKARLKVDLYEDKQTDRIAR